MPDFQNIDDETFCPESHFWGDLFAKRPVFSLFQTQIGGWNPPTDIYETVTGDELEVIVIKMEIAGVNKEDIDIKLDKNILTIQGRRLEEPGARKKNYHLIEVHYGFFQRSFRLPPHIDKRDIQASYKEGFLKITIPKKDTRPGEVRIETEGPDK